MKKYQYILSVLFIFGSLLTNLKAQYYYNENGEKVFQPWDTIIRHENHKIKIKILDYPTFKDLDNRYAHFTQPSEPMKNMNEVAKLLDSDYKFSYSKISDYVNDAGDTIYTCGIDYIEKRGVYRLMFSMDNEGFQAYYPNDKIFLYFGGHNSDQAVFIDTGEPAYNPIYSAVQKKGKYRLTGLHNGQEGINGNLQIWNKKTKMYNNLLAIHELFSQLPGNIWQSTSDYWTRQFWNKNVLYMSIGYGNYNNEEGEQWSGNNTFIAITLFD